MKANKSQYKVNKYYGDDDFVECMKKVIRQVNSKEICKIELTKDNAVQYQESEHVMM
ncbi:hypothetical protein SDC9_175823 [bioreactor metagenome]|uniref:Uncharacterized protein n=1 Tax=bioreactor metagenome TaxID=1076179 RepID=A0A645GR30_9ZZZZ